MKSQVGELFVHDIYMNKVTSIWVFYRVQPVLSFGFAYTVGKKKIQVQFFIGKNRIHPVYCGRKCRLRKKKKTDGKTNKIKLKSWLTCRTFNRIWRKQAELRCSFITHLKYWLYLIIKEKQSSHLDLHKEALSSVSRGFISIIFPGKIGLINIISRRWFSNIPFSNEVL